MSRLTKVEQLSGDDVFKRSEGVIDLYAKQGLELMFFQYLPGCGVTMVFQKLSRREKNRGEKS